ncbi:MAG: UDP-N-acetylglucosamine 4,6-dehydratase (inverting) [Bacteroidia bacterium]|nr:UDP-N-acetylglucosamine 4,6-dehydratase (inverting) [Bacteroidia bacterium]
MFDNKSILITGGTGSFGKKFLGRLLHDHPELRRIIVFSRDELKQYELQQHFPASKHPQLRFFLGDVRDDKRLFRAFEGVDYVVHAAALKQVPAAEYNPFEAIKTNVLGAQNIIEAAIERGVSRVVALSTDKAAAPINLYGATKLCSDKLFVAANNFRGHHDIRFSVVRYGNVIGSRGSVVPFFMEQRSKGVLPITHTDMTRFNISLDEGVDLVLHALEHAWGGELYVPKLPSYKVTDMATAIAPSARQEVVGIRPGEKLHEEMITETDSLNTLEFARHYVICPTTSIWEKQALREAFHGKEVPFGFKYNSGTNSEWLSVEQLREQIRRNVDSSFQPQ